MKKLYIFAIAMISVSTIFAQDRGKNNYKKDNGRQNDYQWSNNQPKNNNRDRNYANNDRNYNGLQQQTEERQRRAEIDRIKRDYDQKIARYRNDRSLNSYERDRRIADTQWERQQKISSFGKGAVAGAIVGLIAGVLFSR